MRAVTVTVAILAILVSTLVMSPRSDDRNHPTQVAVASLADGVSADSELVGPASYRGCHVAQCCMLVILPGNTLDFARFGSVAQAPRLTESLPSEAGHPPFHPPRVLSQV